MILSATEHFLPFAEDLAVWSVVVFVILCALLIRFASGPIIQAMNQRQQQIVETLRQAEIAREQLEKLRAEQEAKRVRSREQAEALIVEAQADAKRTREEIAERSRAEVGRIQNRAEREIHLAKQKALHELELASANLIAGIVEKALRTRLTPGDHRRLVANALQGIDRYAEEVVA